MFEPEADAANGVRRLVLVHGREQARQMVEQHQRVLVDIASEVLGDESGRVGYSYSNLCMTSLPHRRLQDDEVWERTVGNVTLLIEPGRAKFGDGPARPLGVPYGARARLILIYLQTQAIISNSREISLGGSMREWMGRLKLTVGGETAAGLREQARRIATCSMRFTWQASVPRPAAMLRNERIIKSGLFFQDAGAAKQDKQGRLFEDRVLLDADFYDQLREHTVPLQDAAIRQLANSSASLDLYMWLAFRLHHLTAPQTLSWRALHQQFGAGYRTIKGWKRRFLASLAEAVAAYPEANVELGERFITLHPSDPPVRRKLRLLGDKTPRHGAWDG
jgi:hypothetical protein